MALNVESIMTPDPDTVSPDVQLSVVAEMLLEASYSGVPVVVDGEPVGVVEVGDLLPGTGNVPGTNISVLEFGDEWVEEEGVEPFIESLRTRKVEEAMREDFARIGLEASLGEALTALVEEDHRRLLVTDDATDELLGVITRTDLLRLLVGRV